MKTDHCVHPNLGTIWRLSYGNFLLAKRDVHYIIIIVDSRRMDNLFGKSR